MALGDQGAQVVSSGLLSPVNVSESQTEVDTREQSNVDYSGDTYAAKLQLTESSIGTFSTGDFGAIDAGRQIALAGAKAAAEAAQGATDAARQGLTEAGAVLRERSEADISKILKPLGWTAVAIAIVWLISKAMKKGKA